MSPRDWPERVRDILAAIEQIQHFVAGMTFEQFQNDPRTIKAVVANFIIIGEAATRMPDDIIEQNNHIPWRLMRQIRNHLVHVYFNIDPQIVWMTANHDLPPLINPLRQLLDQS